MIWPQDPENLALSPSAEMTKNSTADPNLLGRFFPGSCELRPLVALRHRHFKQYEDFSVSRCQAAINTLLLVGVEKGDDPKILGLIYD